MASPSVVIKKYPDRRLYDPGASRYVKLDDIARMVREGIDVKVLDARSGKDLTASILIQIIVEDSRNRDTALPLQLLQQLIRTSDRATHDFVSWYLNNTMDLYRKAQERVQSRLSDAKSAVSNPLEFVQRLLAGIPSPPPSDTSEVERLRRRVEELEAKLAQTAKGTPAKAAPAEPTRAKPGRSKPKGSRSEAAGRRRPTPKPR